MATGIVVIDPGHGGTQDIGGSDANHAVSPSGVLEKAMTLQMGLLVRDGLVGAVGHHIKVFMTRTTDTNLSLPARANVAKTNRANLFLSIHFNGFNAVARGVETLVRPVSRGNVNHAEDLSFALKIQRRVFAAISARDAHTANRGVKDQVLGVLDDVALGNTAASHPCKACLLEIEFIDVPAVDQLLNTGPNAAAARQDIANAIRDAIIEALT
ncbi:MAG: N-acetylmuramoyl-L-alanine amidase [Acidobacteriota bacterium]